MSKVTVFRTNKHFTMYESYGLKRGPGYTLQPNDKPTYFIVLTDTYTTKQFDTLEEADKEWVFLTLSKL